MSLKVAIAQINSTVGDLDGNCHRIINFSRQAAAAGASVVVTPELSLTGYPPEDLLLNHCFCEAANKTLSSLAEHLADIPGLHVLIGHPFIDGQNRYNACSILAEGKILGTYFKHILPNYSVFDEKRYFSPGTQPLVFTVKGIRFGLAICEDIWSGDVAREAKNAGTDVLLVPTASPYDTKKIARRYAVLRENISALGMAVIYANLAGGQDELVFDGNSIALDHNGKTCLRLAHCREDCGLVCFENGNMLPGKKEKSPDQEEEIYRALVLGTRDYVEKNRFPGAILGLSGGVDSALTLAIATDALGAGRVRAVMMPSPYTSSMSLEDAREMAYRLHVRYDVIPVNTCFNAFRDTLSTQFAGLPEDTTEENLQARIRGAILMALSNKTGPVVLTTGNKSEIAIGYSTLYGDMAGGFAVIRDIPKTLVYRLCRYRNSLSNIIPERILTRPPSAELKANQCDQDSLPPYEVLDEIIRLFVEEGQAPEAIITAGYDRETVQRILSLVRRNEYKRRQAPPGIRITPLGFGREWRYPVTSAYRDCPPSFTISTSETNR
ncbi:MAG: NAD+ synthase [Alistipes senegalensis]|nr:NAD+ synthase [Oxalobacter formigenes]MCM1281649.1 NAD+ synthase [Alistipes senegalensis]